MESVVWIVVSLAILDCLQLWPGQPHLCQHWAALPSRSLSHLQRSGSTKQIFLELKLESAWPGFRLVVHYKKSCKISYHPCRRKGTLNSVKRMNWTGSALYMKFKQACSCRLIIKLLFEFASDSILIICQTQQYYQQVVKQQFCLMKFCNNLSNQLVNIPPNLAANISSIHVCVEVSLISSN